MSKNHRSHAWNKQAARHVAAARALPRPPKRQPLSIWDFLMSIEKEALRANLLTGKDAVTGY